MVVLTNMKYLSRLIESLRASLILGQILSHQPLGLSEGEEYFEALLTVCLNLSHFRNKKVRFEEEKFLQWYPFVSFVPKL